MKTRIARAACARRWSWCGAWAAALMLVLAVGQAAEPGAPGVDIVPSLAPMLARVTPGVVGISIGQASEAANPLLSDPLFRKFFEESGKRKQAAATQVRPAGSGVIIDAARGLVLTNHHVIREANRIVVVLKDRRELPARLLGADAGTDIALLQIAGSGLTALPLGKLDAVQVGDFVVAIGNPFGIGQTVTSGIVSAMGRGGLSPEGYEDYIQTDAAINPGNSGGALVNLRGELIGINTAILTGGEGNRGNIGIGFAVPVGMAQEVARQIERYGEVRRGRVGLQTRDLTPALAAEKQLALGEGALVTAIEPGSPAQQAGLRADDVIVQIDERAIGTAADVRNRLALVAVGSTARLSVQRAGQRLSLLITVAPIPAQSTADVSSQAPARAAEQAAAAPGWGLDVAAGANGALRVTRVDPAGRAHALGLRAGDLIIALNREPPAQPEALTRALGQAGEKTLSILRGETKLRLVVP